MTYERVCHYHAIIAVHCNWFKNIAMPFQKLQIIFHHLHVAKQQAVVYFNQYKASGDVVGRGSSEDLFF